jgi:hypothetical protein
VTDRVPGWIRLGVIVTLALPHLVIGLWAILAPRSWFDSFPGFGPGLVAAEPPYNHHLATDVGAGFFAVGVALLVAAVWARRAGVQVALITFAAFTLPHVIFHATHPADALSAFENAINWLALASGLVLAAVFFWAVHVDSRRSQRPTVPSESGRPLRHEIDGAPSPDIPTPATPS